MANIDGKIDLDNYKRNSEPFSGDAEAKSALEGFYSAVEDARNKFRIANVHVIVKMNIMRDGFVGEGITNAHYGNSLEAPVMCAWALGQEQAEARNIIQKLLKP